MADGLRRETGRRDSAVIIWARDGLLTCRRRAADLHAASDQAEQQTRGRSPSVPPLGGSRKGSGPMCLPVCPNSYQRHERTLMKDRSGHSVDTAQSALAASVPIAEPLRLP